MQKGFTLIELVMVILILGVLALITVPTINSIITDSREKSYNKQIELIEKSANTYMSMPSHSLELPKQGDATCYVTIEMLQNAGLLSDEDILNPKYQKGSTEKTKANETFDKAVAVSFKNNKYVYEYVYEYSVGQECTS